MDSTTSLPTMAPPPGASPAQTHRYSTREWEMQKPTIERLYIEEQQTLSDVMSIMRQEFGFLASRKQFKDRITKWGLDVKNMRGSSILAMGRARVRRKRYEAKDSAFRVNKKSVDEQKINRYLKRKGISEDILLSMPSPINPPSPAFSVYTPSPPTPDPSASSPGAAKSPPLIPAALRRSVVTSSNRGSVELGWVQQTDTPFPEQSSGSIGMAISPPGMKQNSILPNKLLNPLPEASFSISDASSLTPCLTAEADTFMQDFFFHTMVTTPPFPPLPDTQFNNLPILDTCNPPYTQELCRPGFDADTAINSLSSLVEDTNVMLLNTTMSLSVSGQSPRLIDLHFPGSELYAWPWSTVIPPMSMPTPIMSTSPMVDSQLLPQIEMACDSVLDDDVEEIIRAPQILDAGMSMPLGQHISSSSTAPPTLAKDTPIDKIYRQPEIPHGGLEMLLSQTCGILSLKDGPTVNPWARLVGSLVRGSPALYHAIASMAAFHISKEKPAFGVDGMEHLRLSIRSLATDIEDMRTDVVLATTLVLAFSESWNQHASTPIEHLKVVQILVNRVLVSRKRSLISDIFARLRSKFNAWVYAEAILRLVYVDYDDSVAFGNDSILFEISSSDWAEVDPLIGYASTLFPIIGRIASLCHKVRKVESSSIAIISQARKLEEAILQWTPTPFIEQPNGPSSKIWHALWTAEACRYASLIYLYQMYQKLHDELLRN